MRVIGSRGLPCVPSDGENARRMVRHGMADILEWLDKPVGPKPYEATHAMLLQGELFVSPEVMALLRLRSFDGESTHLDMIEQDILDQVHETQRRAQWTRIPLRDVVSTIPYDVETFPRSKPEDWMMPVLHDRTYPIAWG